MQGDSDKEKFGDAQLFSGRDEDDDWPSLADDGAICVWHRDGKPDAEILKSYVAARTAEDDRGRFKVPAYRHPDALRHPVFADFGNSRWSITYSALKAVQDREKLLGKLAAAKSGMTRANVQQRLDAPLDLRGVRLGLWNGSAIEDVDLRWQGAAFGEGSRLPALPSGRSRSHTRRPVWADHRREPGRRGPRRRCLRAERVERPPASALRNWKSWRPMLRGTSSMSNGRKRGTSVACAMWRHLGWFVTISAKLQPSGPWLEYVDAGLPEGWEYRKLRGGGFYLNCEANHGRKGRARLRLSRLPGLRILSVDLGHRYAAACAVWQTLSRKEMDAACRASGRELASAGELFIVLKRPTGKSPEIRASERAACGSDDRLSPRRSRSASGRLAASRPLGTARPAVSH